MTLKGHETTASDRDWHRFKVTPSVLLHCHIPERLQQVLDRDFPAAQYLKHFFMMDNHMLLLKTQYLKRFFMMDNHMLLLKTQYLKRFFMMDNHMLLLKTQYLKRFFMMDNHMLLLKMQYLNHFFMMDNHTLKDAVFEKSTHLRHQVEKEKALDRDNIDWKPIECTFSDGGPDHNPRHGSVQMSQIVHFIQKDLHMSVADVTYPVEVIWILLNGSCRF